MIQDKIKTLEELTRIVATYQTKNKKVVQCHGVFDLLHIGHIRHFEQAKKFGDILIVTVTPDKYVNKGPHRPAFAEGLRAEAIAALDSVDFVAINKWPTAVETIKLLKPNIYAKGIDYKDAHKDHTGKIIDEEAAIKSVGGEIAFTNDITFSSSRLINKYLPTFPREIIDYLATFSDKYSSDDVIQYLKNIQSLKVLVVGETIIDEYQFCESMGKAGKEPVLVLRYDSTERFAGGVLAVANHLASFCDNVGLLTMIGEGASQVRFIRQSVKDNVDIMFLHKANSPTIIKRRFLENYLLQKLFEVCEINDEELSKRQSQDLCAMLEEIIPKYDVVIVVDYGHGMLTRDAIELLCSEARFLAVNVQINAANKGLSTISKYPRADYVCLTEPEIRLDCKNRQGELRDMVSNVSQKMGCKAVVVTQGKNGSLCYSEKEGFVEVPAFAQQIVDRVGAGDAVLSLTSLCVAQQTPVAVVGFIGNVVGAQAVAILGHRTSIERGSLFKHIESLLK